MSDTSNASNAGFFGGVLAATISAALNHSFWWGLLHFCLSWIYVLYVILFRTKEIIPALRAMFGV